MQEISQGKRGGFHDIEIGEQLAVARHRIGLRAIAQRIYFAINGGREGPSSTPAEKVCARNGSSL